MKQEVSDSRPQAVYTLTEKGKLIKPLIDEMAAFAKQYES
jgi:DNA-binding HxlR family transcriptional regulator